MPYDPRDYTIASGSTTSSSQSTVYYPVVPNTTVYYPVVPNNYSYVMTPAKCKTCRGKGRLRPLADGFRPTCPKCHGKKEI